MAGDRRAGDRVLAEFAFLAGGFGATGLGELAGELALRIVGAGDEGAVFAAAQAEAAVGAALRRALRAGARVGAVFARREQVVAEEFIEGLGDLGGLLCHHLVGLGLEIAPEGFEHRLPAGAAARDVVEFLLHAGGEFIGDVAGEEAFEERREQAPGFLGEEAVLFDADVGAVLEHLQGGGVGRGAADAEFFEAFHQRRFGEARRGLGEVLRGVDLFLGRHVARLHVGEQALVIVAPNVTGGIGFGVAALVVDGEEAGELHHLAGGAQRGLAGAVAQGDAGAFEFGAGHLAGDRALPDQGVEPGLVAIAVGVAGEFGGTDRLVRFLRVLRLGGVNTRFFGAIVAREAVGDLHAGGGDGAVVHLHAVGAHVGDRAGLVQGLRDAHGVHGGEAELARGLLLQGGGGERGVGIAADRLGLDILDAEGALFDGLFGAGGDAGLAEAEFIEFAPFEVDQAGEEGGAVVAHVRGDLPVFLGLERLDLAVTLDDQAQGDRLDAAGGFGAGELAPEHRREGEPEQVIERAAREVGIDQVLIEFARVLHRRGDGFLGDRVEGDALDLLGQHAALGQQFAHVPTDRLALAVRVGGEDQAVGLFGQIADLADAALFVAVQLPVHREVLVRADRTVFRRQVADVAVGGEDAVVLAQVLLDGFRLGGRFDDD